MVYFSPLEKTLPTILKIVLRLHSDDITHNKCGKSQPNVVDVADINTEFTDFVFFDMPGWQSEYADECSYHTFYEQLLGKMDFIYFVWDVNHGKVDDKFAAFFEHKAHGTDYSVIYNRYEEGSANMAFLNQQYGKMNQGSEILSEGYVLKLHEKSAKYAEQYDEDILMLRSKISSVNL